MGTQMNDRRAEPKDTVYKKDNSLLKQVPSLSQIQITDEENTPENDTACKKRDSLMNLLQKLGLTDSYPKKMSQANVLLIDTLSLSVNQPSSEKELISHYLYKLTMLDYRARYMFIKHDTSSMDLEDAGATVDNDDFFDFSDNILLDVSCTEAQIHPMDVHMAVFHCANDFLRQYIVKKLSTCQFAIPFLVPDPCTEEVEFPFWVLQYISKSWQSNTNSIADSPGKYKSRKMSCTPVPVVSFIRLGESNSNSKSQIMNGVISKQKHSVFFHRHCKGSTKDSLLMNGVVEIAWYCPGGKEDDIFDDCVAFLNLHGDAAKHQKQLEFLQAVSTVNVLLLSEHPLDEAEKAISQKLSMSPVPLICMFSGKELIQRSNNPTKVRLAAKNRNHAEFTEELILSIRQCIGENKQTTNIDMCRQVAIQQQFKVNEVHKTYQEGYEQAQTLISLLKEESSSALKEKVLPLQGELWHEWCRKNKEQYRLQCKEKESIEQQLSEISTKMEAIRESQLFKATPLNDFVRSFIECLSKPNSSQDTKLYTLQWLTIFLDDLTTDVLAELEVDYQSTWRKMREVPKDKEKTSHVNKMQTKLNNISDKMTATTISLQHLMREVGQLYEASQTTPKAPGPTKQFSTILPKIGADMLVYGCPLELMDGDAAHVPLTWIEAVMDELVNILGDRKLFVLSILGLQSSGKSTLLNTMFGVQFSVSVGRCTRGAFMQLIPVDSSIRNKLGYDFILIVDTEGLRSPELSTKTSVNHDNELATFIIGIGDITVINIMGENPAEMQDILQICVQAFLRMKQVKIAPSCIFVHQNVADASAGEKAMEGRRCLLQKLDKMATIAGKEENVDGINEFSDVIQFDIESHVFYFKNLLEGDPPMAPPNPSYSQNVQELKTKLLTIAEWKTKHKFSSFSEFKLRVCDLWKALLQENFVFSFRNTVEMMVYTSLEEKYAAWSWELRKHALEMQSKLHNQIGSSIMAEVNVSDLTENFDKVYNQLQNEMDKYFKEDRNKEILIKWSVSTDKRFWSLRTELIDGTVKKCKELITNKNNRSELDQRKTEYTAELTKQSKALASNLKAQRIDDKQVTKEFDKLWGNWTAKVAKAHTPNECVNVKAVVEAILQKDFEKQPNVIQKIQGGTGNFEFDKEKHVSQSFFQWMRSLGRDFSQQVEQLQQEVTHSVETYVTAKETSKEDFDLSFIHEILKKIDTIIAEFESSTGKLKFTNEFKADISINLCLKYVSRFQRMQETFKTSNHPLTYLESQRDNYLQAFRNYCKGTNSVTVFVDFLCKHIKPEFLTAVNEKTSRHIADELKSNNPAFNSNRSNLESHILKHLATVEDFSSFAEYIDFPKRYFERFIQEKINNFCSNTRKLHEMHEKNLGTLKNQILSASTGATREVEDKKGNASMWLDCFCDTLGEHMVINRNDLHTIENEDIEDWTFFKDVMAKSLDEILKDEKAIDMETLRKKPTEYLFNQLQGCWAQCPFCKAICTNTITNHDGEHSVTFHRCDALAGWHPRGTDHFSINFCTTAVSSDDRFFPRCNENESIPYKTYRNGGDPYNKWNITPDGSVQRYWKWFICPHQGGSDEEGELVGLREQGQIRQKSDRISKKSSGGFFPK
ncbi:interferon-induced very large GTPase 1-like [Anguilla anguilla]|uniref:interferon-induced very large GTPase 1-like n=1 Tax=Anguilla anguilla TaxID=7936 RepID=UPI0015B15383|nr:interferon-induced very large GTPase 1-like [Anguilla anguilla]